MLLFFRQLISIQDGVGLGGTVKKKRSSLGNSVIIRSISSSKCHWNTIHPLSLCNLNLRFHKVWQSFILHGVHLKWPPKQSSHGFICQSSVGLSFRLEPNPPLMELQMPMNLQVYDWYKKWVPGFEMNPRPYTVFLLSIYMQAPYTYLYNSM